MRIRSCERFIALSFIIEKFRLVKRVKIIFWIPAYAGMTGKECALIQVRFTSSAFYLKNVLLQGRFTSSVIPAQAGIQVS